MREVAGYLTHPDIPFERPDLRVADVGTGTGSEPDAPTAASERLVQIWHKRDPIGKYSWIENLKTLCEQAGLEDVSQSRHGWPDYLRPLWAQSSLASTEDVLPEAGIWDTKEGGLTAKFIEDLQREIAQGVAVDTTFQCVIGRKVQSRHGV
ncbi:MAG: hypothetical protein Q9216_004866 [Gyalolechia sp. 2 TL-2023]